MIENSKDFIYGLLPKGCKLHDYEKENVDNNLYNRPKDIYYLLYNKNLSITEHCSIIDKLIEQGMSFDFWDFRCLSKDCKIEILEHIDSKGVNINLIDDCGENLLFKLLETNSYDYTKDFDFLVKSFNKLTKLGINYQHLNNNGRNLIHKAIREGVVSDFLVFILGLDLDVNLQDNDGYTPLHFAGGDNWSKTQIKLLLNFGAEKSKSIKSRDKSYDLIEESSGKGLTPLELYKIRAVGEDYRDEEIVTLLN